MSQGVQGNQGFQLQLPDPVSFPGAPQPPQGRAPQISQAPQGLLFGAPQAPQEPEQSPLPEQEALSPLESATQAVNDTSGLVSFLNRDAFRDPIAVADAVQAAGSSNYGIESIARALTTLNASHARNKAAAEARAAEAARAARAEGREDRKLDIDQQDVDTKASEVQRKRQADLLAKLTDERDYNEDLRRWHAENPESPHWQPSDYIAWNTDTGALHEGAVVVPGEDDTPDPSQSAYQIFDSDGNVSDIPEGYVVTTPAAYNTSINNQAKARALPDSLKQIVKTNDQDRVAIEAEIASIPLLVQGIKYLDDPTVQSRFGPGRQVARGIDWGKSVFGLNDDVTKGQFVEAVATRLGLNELNKQSGTKTDLDALQAFRAAMVGQEITPDNIRKAFNAAIDSATRRGTKYNENYDTVATASGDDYWNQLKLDFPSADGTQVVEITIP